MDFGGVDDLLDFRDLADLRDLLEGLEEDDDGDEPELGPDDWDEDDELEERRRFLFCLDAFRSRSSEGEE